MRSPDYPNVPEFDCEFLLELLPLFVKFSFLVNCRFSLYIVGYILGLIWLNLGSLKLDFFSTVNSPCVSVLSFKADTEYFGRLFYPLCSFITLSYCRREGHIFFPSVELFLLESLLIRYYIKCSLSTRFSLSCWTS